jgi:hypothetical protein
MGGVVWRRDQGSDTLLTFEEGSQVQRCVFLVIPGINVNLWVLEEESNHRPGTADAVRVCLGMPGQATQVG